MVVAVVGPDLKDALDVHLDDGGLFDSVLRGEEFVEDGVVEGLRTEKPNGQTEASCHFSGLAGRHDAGRARHAAHADDGNSFVPGFYGCGVSHEVGGVGVARSGGGNHAIAVSYNSRFGLPRGTVTLESTHQCGVDEIVLEGVTQQGRDKAPVLSRSLHRGISCAGEDDITDTKDVIVRTLASITKGVDLALPRAKARTSAGAHGAGGVRARSSIAVDVNVEGLVRPVLVVIGQDVMGANNDASCTSRAEPRGHDFAKEFGPVWLFGAHDPTIGRLLSLVLDSKTGRPSLRYPAGMPEILEVESYRQLADRVVGATVKRGFSDRYAAKKLSSPGMWSRAVAGLTITGTSRRGKLMLIETNGPLLGMRFGMTGVLLLDSDAGIDGLFYGPHTYKKDWIRAGLELRDGRTLLLHDPRRLGRVEVEPDLSELGPDALSISRADFNKVMSIHRGEGPALKAHLLDQSKVAGIGNLLGDEMLFRAGIDPRRGAGTLTQPELSDLYAAWKKTMTTLQRRGGSHTGDHMEGRTPGGVCPRDGATMLSATIGGRTTYWCSQHQH